MNSTTLQDRPISEVLADVRSLSDDWDGAGAVAPGADMLAESDRVLKQLADQKWPSPHRIFALSSGEVVLEWDNGPGHFEIEVAGLNKLSWMRTTPGLTPVHGNAITSAVLLIALHPEPGD
jgi:hypothetical protein